MGALVAYRGLTLSDNIDDYPEGIIVPVDKPYRWTSADVVRKVKWAAGKHFHKKNLKVGHAGTLDPLATGVLLVCIGKATKLAESLQAREKEYLAGVTFGATTPSYDREKDIDAYYPVDGVSLESVSTALDGFKGEQEQVAPLFSAKSVDGVRAYELARKAYRAHLQDGAAFDHSAEELLSRQYITIYDIALESFEPGSGMGDNPSITPSAPAAGASGRINVADTEAPGLPRASIRVNCSKGTYIRALARDLGEAVGSGAFLHSLRRTRNGGFRVEDALGIDDVLQILASASGQ